MSLPLNITQFEQTVRILVEFMVRHPDAAIVQVLQVGERVQIIITVDPRDLGTMIGRQGSLARALRTTFNVISAKYGLQLTLDLLAHPDNERTARIK